MKKIYFLLFFLICNITTYSQCSCKNVYVKNETIKVCDPLPVAKDNSSQIGLAVSKVDAVMMLSVTSRFSNNSQNFYGDEISLTLQNDTIIELPFLNSQKGLVGGSQVSQGIFQIRPFNAEKLLDSDIKVISFKLKDGVRRFYQPSVNESVLKDQIRCILTK